jgi:hypothetical protein
MDLEKDDVRNLRLLPCAATAEKYRISAFRETPKDQPRVFGRSVDYAGAEQKLLFYPVGDLTFQKKRV